MSEKLYYMRDNHTFVPLPREADGAIAVLRQEFEDGWNHGMLCSDTRRPVAHAHGDFTEFEPRARAWFAEEIAYRSPGDLEFASWQARAALPVQQGWQPISTRPMDGTRYLAVDSLGNVRLVRQADPEDRLPLMDTPSPWPELPIGWMPLPNSKYGIETSVLSTDPVRVIANTASEETPEEARIEAKRLRDALPHIDEMTRADVMNEIERLERIAALWQAVPREITPAMALAFWSMYDRATSPGSRSRTDLRGAYRAMLEASPQPKEAP